MASSTPNQPTFRASDSLRVRRDVVAGLDQYDDRGDFIKKGLIGNSTNDEIIFPGDLIDGNTSKYMQICVYEKIRELVLRQYVYLPIPAALQFQSSASYSALNLGVGGGALLNAAASATAALKSASTKDLEIVKSYMSFAKPVAIGLAKAVVPDHVLSLAKFSGKVIENANTNTQFEGNSIRSFTFNFKMIPTTPHESADITALTSLFRRNMHASSATPGSNLFLSYPSVFSIRFMEQGGDIKHIPKIYFCYLTDCSMSVNPTSSMFFEETGAPHEVDLSLTFQETRVLTRADIERLEEYRSTAAEINPLEEEGIDAYGNATTEAGTSTLASPYEIEKSLTDLPSQLDELAKRETPTLYNNVNTLAIEAYRIWFGEGNTNVTPGK